MSRGHDDYIRAIDLAVSLGGPPEGWNERFLAALDEQGLKLIPTSTYTPPLHSRLVIAPVPYRDGWPQSWIVEKDQP